MNKIDFNKKMLGKKVSVETNGEPWVGQIVEIVDEDNFAVLSSFTGKIQTISIYDIRSLDYEETQRK